MPSVKTRVALLNENYRTADGAVDQLLTTTEASTSFQAKDGTLTALSSYNTVGLLTQTSTAPAFTGRTLTAGSTRVSISAGNGSTGNPTVDVNSFPSTVLSDSTGLARTTTNNTFAGPVAVPDSTYGSSWNGSAEVPTKNAIYDKIETMTGGAAGYEAGPPTPPTAVDLATWLNQGTSTWTDGTGSGILKPQVDDRFVGRYKAAPGTPYDVYCRLNIQFLSTAAVTTGPYILAGIMFQDTAGDNERLGFGIQCERISGDEQHLWSAQIQRWTGATPPVFSAQPVLKYNSRAWQWIRVNNDGTTLTLYVSMDGKDWLSVGTETLAAFIDGAASYGVFARSGSNATEAIALFSYFSTTAPA